MTHDNDHSPHPRPPMRVLIACEFSGVVRDAFTAQGHDATSCDILPSDTPGQHVAGDVRPLLTEQWDLVIAHPPCTYMANSGAKHLYELDENGHTILDKNGHRIPNPERWHGLYEAAMFFRACLAANAPRVAVENPKIVGHATKLIGAGPTQYVHPWMFGHGETKETGLWLRGLPPLEPTDVVDGREHRIHRMSPGPDRGKERSRTYAGIAAAMATQWGALPVT